MARIISANFWPSAFVEAVSWPDIQCILLVKSGTVGLLASLAALARLACLYFTAVSAARYPCVSLGSPSEGPERVGSAKPDNDEQEGAN